MTRIERPSGFIANLPNCGVTAIAMVAGQPYRAVWDWFQKHNDFAPNWKGRTYASQYVLAMKAFNVTFKRAPTGMTVAKFAEWHTLPGRTYLMGISGHVFVLRDGIISDNTRHHGKPASVYGRRKVERAWLINKDVFE